MTDVGEQTKTKETYLKIYRTRYPKWDGQENPPALLVEDVDGWLNRWIGFDTFLETLTNEAFLGESALADLQNVMNKSPAETWAEGLMDHMASILGWYAIEVAFLMDDLEKHRKKKGLGQVLKWITQTDGGYFGHLDPFNQGNGRDTLLHFYHTHAGLYEWAKELFLNIFYSLAADEKIYQTYLAILKTDGREERLQTLAVFWREHLYESVVGQMFIWIGFYHHLQHPKESGDR